MSHAKRHLRRPRRRAKIIASGVVVGLVLGFGSFALAAWVGEGTGSTTTTETTGTAAGVGLNVSAGAETDALVAGGPAGDIPITIYNTSAGAANVSSVTLTVTGTSDPNCDASNFTASGPTEMNVGGTLEGTPFVIPAGVAAVADGNPRTAAFQATVAVNTNASPACQDVTVDLLVVVS